MHVYEHSIDSPAVRRVLENTLPHSLPTLRRVSFPYPPGRPLKLFATFQPASDETPPAFALALFDDVTSGRRAASLFSSLELDNVATETSDDTSSKNSKVASEESLFSLIAFIAKLCNENPRLQPVNAANGADPPKNALLLTHLHANNFTSLRSAAQKLRSNSEHDRLMLNDPAIAIGYMKYIVHRQALFSSRIPSLPENLYFDRVHSEDDYAYVIANNDIANRFGKTLLEGLPSVGIRLGRNSIPDCGRKEGELVAFGFVGFDGSFRTMYTDPGFRRQSLGKAVLFELAEIMKDIWDGPIEWYHTDVGDDNMASRGLFESIGCTRGWYDYWVSLDTKVAILL